jgi:hypothetical protein
MLRKRDPSNAGNETKTLGSNVRICWERVLQRVNMLLKADTPGYALDGRRKEVMHIAERYGQLLLMVIQESRIRHDNHGLWLPIIAHTQHIKNGARAWCALRQRRRRRKDAAPAWLMTRSALRKSSSSEGLKRKMSTARPESCALHGPAADPSGRTGRMSEWPHWTTSAVYPRSRSASSTVALRTV